MDGSIGQRTRGGQVYTLEIVPFIRNISRSTMGECLQKCLAKISHIYLRHNYIKLGDLNDTNYLKFDQNMEMFQPGAPAKSRRVTSRLEPRSGDCLKMAECCHPLSTYLYF